MSKHRPSERIAVTLIVRTILVHGYFRVFIETQSGWTPSLANPAHRNQRLRPLQHYISPQASGESTAVSARTQKPILQSLAGGIIGMPVDQVASGNGDIPLGERACDEKPASDAAKKTPARGKRQRSFSEIDFTPESERHAKAIKEHMARLRQAVESRGKTLTNCCGQHLSELIWRGTVHELSVMLR